jgi:hypothetical protein
LNLNVELRNRGSQKLESLVFDFFGSLKFKKRVNSTEGEGLSWVWLRSDWVNAIVKNRAEFLNNPSFFVDYILVFNELNILRFRIGKSSHYFLGFFIVNDENLRTLLSLVESVFVTVILLKRLTSVEVRLIIVECIVDFKIFVWYFS